MKELQRFLHFYQIKCGGTYKITADVFLKLMEKFKDYD